MNLENEKTSSFRLFHWMISSPVGDGEDAWPPWRHLDDTWHEWWKSSLCRLNSLLTMSRANVTQRTTKRNWCTVAWLLDPLFSTGLYLVSTTLRPRYVTIFNFDQSRCTRPVPIDENALDVVLGYFVFGARALFRKRDDIMELQLMGLAGRNNSYGSGCSLILYILCLLDRLKLSIRYRVRFIIVYTIAWLCRQNFFIAQLNKKLNEKLKFFFFLFLINRWNILDYFCPNESRAYIANTFKNRRQRINGERCQCHRYI